MNPKEKTEQSIKQFEASTTEEMDKWVCTDALEAIRKAKHAQSSKARPNICRNILKNRTAQIAAAAVLIIAVLAGIDYFSSPVGVTTPAFAEVIQPFLSARTATFTITGEGPNDPPSFSMNGMFAEPDRMRFEIAGAVEMVQIFDIQKSAFVTLMPEQKTAIVIEMANMPAERQRQANMFFDIRRHLREAQDADNGDVELLGERQIDGVNSDGYLLSVAPGIEITFWVDVESLLPVRIEYDMSEMFGKEMKMVMSDFAFDVELDDSLFSLETPEGYTLRTMQMDASEPQEEDLIEMFVVWAEATGGKFPSALSLNVEVLKEFIMALTGDILKQESQAFPEDNEQLHELLFEIKQDLTQLQGIIQDSDNKEKLDLLAENIKSHLQQLLDIEEQQQEAEQRYMDELMSRSEDLASDPFQHVEGMIDKITPVTQGLAFVLSLPPDSDWHYAGKAVEYGDGDAPIFWYRPEGMGICRVVYGDLTVADVDLSEQPEDPEVVPAEATEDIEDSNHSPGTARPRAHPLIAGEEDFIEALGMWADFVDNRFPDSVSPIDIMRDLHSDQRERLSKDGRLPSDKQVAEMREDMLSILHEINDFISKGLLFPRMLNADSNWRYAGKGITYGDSDKAVFWYKPEGSDQYRIIYADLTVEQTTSDRLPVDSGQTQRYEDIRKKKVEQTVLPSDPAAVEILKKVQEAYNSMETYRSVCEVIADYNTSLILDVNNLPDLTQQQVEQLEDNPRFKKISNRRCVEKASLIMKLARPELYCMEWTKRYIEGPGSDYSFDTTGCIWSDPNGHYGIKYGKKKTYRTSYLGAGPWSSGETVPAIFYSRFDNTLKALEGLVKEKDDTVDGQLCYVISGLRYNKAVRLWISKQRFLILKREQEINFEDRTSVSDKDRIAAILKITDEEVAPEEIELMQNRTIKGSVIEIQRDIIVDEPIGKGELVPSESKAKESLDANPGSAM